MGFPFAPQERASQTERMGFMRSSHVQMKFAMTMVCLARLVRQSTQM